MRNICNGHKTKRGLIDNKCDLYYSQNCVLNSHDRI